MKLVGLAQGATQVKTVPTWRGEVGAMLQSMYLSLPAEHVGS